VLTPSGWCLVADVRYLQSGWFMPALNYAYTYEQVISIAYALNLQPHTVGQIRWGNQQKEGPNAEPPLATGAQKNISSRPQT
jgi:hypothetical protein